MRPFFLLQGLLALVLLGSTGAAATVSLRDEAGLARRAGDLARAEQLFRQAQAQQPTHEGISLDLIVVLTDRAQFQEAQSRLQQHKRQWGESEAYWMTRAYWHDKQGDFFNSLTCYDNALLLNPHSVVARRNRIHTVDTLGMPDKALELAQAHPSVMRDEDWLRLYTDSAAYAVRMAAVHDDNKPRYRQRVTAAIRQCDKAISFLTNRFPQRQTALQQARMDRLLVWGLDSRHQAVLDEYHALMAEGAALRDDTRMAVAQSALQLEQPLLAVSLLEPLLQRPKPDANARTLLFYAYQESEQFERAQQTINALVRDEPAWRYGQSPKVIVQNEHRVNAEQNQWMLAAWGNQLAVAQPGLETYQVKAPANASLHTALGDLYQLRGWPRRAIAEYDAVLLEEPLNQGAQQGMAGSVMDLYDFPATEKLTQSLVRDYPELKSTESLQEDWAVHNMQEVSATFTLGRSDSLGGSRDHRGSGVNGSRDLEAEWLWFSRPIDYQHRVFFHASSATGDFEEGKGQIDRYGVGWEKRERVGDWAFRHTAEINRSVASEADPGVSLTTDWQIDDNWSVAGELETFSSQLPVRAYNDGVTAHSLGASTQYRVDEGEYYRAGVTAVDFSDGNQRWMFNGTGYQVFYSRPHHQWAVVESVYASSNSRSNNDTLYFNPRHDLELGLALEYQGILRRHYDFSWRHTLLVGMGAYAQQDYDTGPVAQLEYRHDWVRDKTVSWFYGIAIHRHPYDGNDELREALLAGFTWRFD